MPNFNFNPNVAKSGCSKQKYRYKKHSETDFGITGQNRIEHIPLFLFIIIRWHILSKRRKICNNKYCHYNVSAMLFLYNLCHLTFHVINFFFYHRKLQLKFTHKILFIITNLVTLISGWKYPSVSASVITLLINYCWFIQVMEFLISSFYLFCNDFYI